MGIGNSDREELLSRIDEVAASLNNLRRFATDLPAHRGTITGVPNQAQAQPLKTYKFKLLGHPRIGTTTKPSQSCIYCETLNENTEILVGTQCLFIEVEKLRSTWKWTGAACLEHEEDLEKIWSTDEKMF